MDNEQNMAPQGETKERSFGPLISIVVIIAVLVIGGLYFFWNKPQADESDQAQTTSLPELSQSDEINSIESDIQATENFDAELSDIEADLDAEFDSI
jgi:hypothetical protein